MFADVKTASLGGERQFLGLELDVFLKAILLYDNSISSFQLLGTGGRLGVLLVLQGVALAQQVQVEVFEGSPPGSWSYLLFNLNSFLLGLRLRASRLVADPLERRFFVVEMHLFDQAQGFEYICNVV